MARAGKREFSRDISAEVLVQAIARAMKQSSHIDSITIKDLSASVIPRIELLAIGEMEEWTKQDCF